jgi:predicted amidophosphoribosyltransferase
MARQPILTQERAVFEVALRQARCPKCRGKVMEISMPDVVCEKCGAQYMLASRFDKGFFGSSVNSRLIEKNQPQPSYSPQFTPQAAPQAASGRFCYRCGSPLGEGARFCAGCGTQL